MVALPLRYLIDNPDLRETFRAWVQSQGHDVQADPARELELMRATQKARTESGG